MKKRKSFFAPVTAMILFIIVSFSACSPAEKKDPADAQANADSSAVESEAGNTGRTTGAGGTGEESSAGENTAADRAASDLPEDGVHVPTMFTVSGGTGRVTITCPEVVLTEGAAQARIEFSSPHYEWVKVDDVQYDPENADDKDRKNSVFSFPVRLDEEMTISGLTTAMSEPHEIEYTIFISLTREEEKSTADGSGEDSAGKDGAEDSAGNAPEENGDNVSADGEDDGEDVPAAGKKSSKSENASQPPALEGLTFVSAMETSYAETFDIFTYQPAEGSAEDLYRLIDVHDSGRYLVLPENSGADKSAEQQKILKALPASVTVLQAPLDNIYVAATSSMALFDGAGAISQVKLTGTKAKGWYIDAPKKALADGSMVYAGKYSAPDYELLASSGCDLAVESMMILHTPEVMEKLEELGIPVFIDTSSNESHPLGRTEWVRLYGVLTGHEKEAEAFFEEQAKEFAEAENYTAAGLTVAFFSISSKGNVIVRATDDYIPRMIELAGGTYVFQDLFNESGNNASVRLSMEDFYQTAKDADYLIYNATIENPVRSISELCGRSALLTDFKAVQNGNVWQVERSLYQSPDIAAQMITDLHRMLTGENTSGMVFLKQLD
ncbi:MAG: ABC transporter substrate-binding protein [Eubacteriales bacterium]|nr:ABC transporter substrate-binding protein [Eubacteriales bacterium]